MNTRRLLLRLAPLTLLAAAGAWALAEPAEDGDDEVEIKLTEAPAAVQAALTKVAAAPAVTKVIKEEDEGITTFEIEFTDHAVECSAVFSSAGDLMELEKTTPQAQLPAAVLAAIKKDYPTATLADPQTVTKTYYEVQVVIDGRKHEIRCDAAGNIDDESDEGDEHADAHDADEKHDPHAAAPAATPDAAWRDTFAVNKADLSPTGAGTYFILQPGRKMTYTGGDVLLVVTVLDETRVVDGVTTRIVEERETKAGALEEVSRNFFTIDPKTGDAYYFGEEVDIYKDGKVVKHEGEWLSGQNGARFGLFIPGAAKLGDKFYQEIAPHKAMDRFEIVSVDEHVKTAAGEFDKVIKTKETTPIESGMGYKWFAPGVGMIGDDDLRLTDIQPGKGK